jgi:hypothetical protein
VEHLDALPVDVWRRGEGIQKIQLGRSGRYHDAGSTSIVDGVPQSGRSLFG